MPPAESWAGLRDLRRAIHQPSGGNGRLAVAAPMLRSIAWCAEVAGQLFPGVISLFRPIDTEHGGAYRVHGN